MTDRIIGRLFRRNYSKNNQIRHRYRWSRPRLNLDRLEDRSVPATITVTSTGDNIASDSSVTLREAIQAINLGADTSDVVATGTYGVNDTIVFSGLFSSPQTILVPNSQMSIGRSVTITGPGMNLLTIQNSTAQGADSRIFDVGAVAGIITVKISGMTLTGGNVSAGNVGGAIRNADEFLELTNVALTGNSAVGGSTAAGAGGAIAMTAGGKLTLDSCTFSGNTATGTGTTTASVGFGGAIEVAAPSTITINNSTFSNNGARIGGGVIHVGISASGSTVFIGSSTMTANTASNNTGLGGGGVLELSSTGNTVTLNNDSITGNSAVPGGVIFIPTNTATTTLNTIGITNTAFGSNTASEGGVLHMRNPALVTINNSTFTANTATGGSTGGGVFYWLTQPSTVTVNGSTFDANVATGGYGGVVNMASGTLASFSATDSTFTNNIAAGTNGAGAIYDSASNATIALTRTQFINNAATGTTSASGGAIRVNTSTVTLTIDQSIFDGNVVGSATSSTSGGGAIALTSASAGAVSINGSTFSNNSHSVNGGAIYGDNSTPITITNSTFSGTSAGGNATSNVGGGAIFHSGSSLLKINNSTLVFNTAGGTNGQGGGILRTNSGSFTTLISSIIAKNTAVTGQDVRATFAQVVSGGANLIGVADDGNVSFKSTNGANLTGTKALPLNPQVGPLADNGGPSVPHTFTHGLLPGSPASGKGNQNGLAIDQAGKVRPAVGPSIGATEVTLKVPSAAVSSLTNVTTTGGTNYSVTVVYTDETGIDTATLDQDDVFLSGPSFSSVASSKSAPVIGGGGKTATVTYSFPVPGGTWDITDNGSYTISMQGNQVFDTDTPIPNSVTAGTFGTFNVAIPLTYVVNDNAADVDDADPNNGLTTLREAINLSNSLNVGVADVITFAPSMNGKTILLGSELPITDPVVIQGNGGGNITIDGNNASRIFNFAITGTAVSTPSTISNLTLTKGKPATLAGGAIKLDANTLTLSNVTITASVGATNSGAVAVTTGNLSVIDSTLSGNSGGTAGALSVGSGGQITVIRSNISGNTATGTAGGISIGLGSVTIIDSAITDNVANGNSTSSGGGGIFMGSAGVLNITNSTIARNLVPNGVGQGAGIFLSTSANVTINNATIAYNTAAGIGGGFAGNATSTSVAPVTMDIRSTIIAYNSAPTAPDVYSKSTNPVVFNATVSDSIIGVDGGTMIYASSNNQTNIDAKLSPLGFYGGSTKSIGLLPGSPALDAGSNTLGLVNDQRGTGFPRAVNGLPDVGAFEGLVPTPTAIAILNPAVKGASTYTIDVIYSSTVGLDTTSFDKTDVYVTGPGYVGNATPTINPSISGSGSSVTVTYTFAAPGGTWGNEDNGIYNLTLQGNQVFDINAVAALPGSLGTFVADIGTTYIVDNTDDTDDGNYGAGQFTLREAISRANKFASADTISFDPSLMNPTISVASELAISQSVVIQGSASTTITIQGNGNRIFNVNISGSNGKVSMSDLTLTGGNASTTTAGGAILNADDALTLTNMTFSGNAATGSFAQGGAIANSGSGAVVNISKSTFTGNNATGGGGAIYFSSAGSLTINASKFESNSAGSGGSNGGGAIYSQSTLTLDISDSTFTANTTSANWGGVIAIISATTITVNKSRFESNMTTGSGGGGAIYASSGLGASTLDISDSTFTMNSTGSTAGGGAIYFSSTSTTLTIDKSVLTNNTANGNVSGGAIYVTGPVNGAISDSVLTNNRAGTFGGAVDFASTCTVVLDNVLISDNIVDGSSAEGGGVFISGGSLTVMNSGIVNNVVSPTGSFGGSGGGISSSSAAITILNSTLSGNRANNVDSSSNNPGGGAIAIRATSGGSLVVRNSTITNNTATNSLTASTSRGGGILIGKTSGASVTIESSIVAGNNNPAGHSDIYLVASGSPIDGDNNIIGVADVLNLSGVNNKTGTLASPFNPGLFPLSFNGGISPTHPLWYNSPALNAGLNSQGLAFDQRGAGFPREIGAPDIGAFEGFLDVSPFVVTTSGIVNVVAAGSGVYEFTVTYDGFKGVDAASVNTGDVTLALPGGSTVTPTLVSKTVNGNAVTGKYSFTAPGGSWDPTDNGTYTITLNANEVFDNDSPTPKSVPAQSLGTFTASITGNFVVDNNGDADDGNYSTGNLTLREAIKLSNLNSGNVDSISFALPNGTTIGLGGTELSITDPVIITGPGFDKLTISGNFGSRIFGFNILGAGAESKISDLTLTNGMASTGSGGAISADNDALTLTNVRLTNNTATAGVGGAISVGTTTLILINTEFTGNSASGDGGAIKSVSTSGTSSIEVTDSLFSGNQGAAGGAISMPTSTSGATLTVTNSKFVANTASGNGGAISLTVSPVTITGSVLTANVSNSNASGGGGGALSSNTSIITITDSEISDNQVTGSSAGGGAIRVGGSSSNITIQNTTISGNSAAGNGGAMIFNSATSPTLNVFNSTIANNTASGLGGAIYTAGTGSSQPIINLTSSIVAQNADTVTADIWSALDESTATFNLSVNAVDSIVSLNTHAKIIVNGSGNTLVGTAGSPINAKLGALTNNGGSTRTMGLLTGSPAINTGSNPNALSFDQRGTGFLREVGQADMGAFEVQGAATPAKVSNITINNGAPQRSRVTELKVTFDQIVTFSGSAAAAFQLQRQNDNALPPLVASVDNSGPGTVVTLTFPISGTALNFSSLADGRYTLTIFANQVTNSNGELDGDGNGVGGDNYIRVGTPANGLFRLYGDSNGDGTVDGADFLQFRLAFLQSNSTFDFDGNGTVDGGDFLQFRLRFLQSI